MSDTNSRVCTGSSNFREVVFSALHFNVNLEELLASHDRCAAACEHHSLARSVLDGEVSQEELAEKWYRQSQNKTEK